MSYVFVFSLPQSLPVVPAVGVAFAADPAEQSLSGQLAYLRPSLGIGSVDEHPRHQCHLLGAQTRLPPSVFLLAVLCTLHRLLQIGQLLGVVVGRVEVRQQVVRKWQLLDLVTSDVLQYGEPTVVLQRLHLAIAGYWIEQLYANRDRGLLQRIIIAELVEEEEKLSAP